MTANSVNNSVNNYTFPESKQVPEVSSKSISIFKENNLQTPNTLIDLKSKVESLEAIQKKLIDATENSQRNKIISILAAMLVLSLIAGAALGSYFCFSTKTMFGAVFTVLIPLATFLISSFLGKFYDEKWSENGKTLISMKLECLAPLAMATVGPFIPIYRTFGSISRYQKQLELEKIEVKKVTEEVKQFFSDNKVQVEGIKKILEGKISKQRQDLESLKKSQIKFIEKTEKALLKEIKRMELALDELNKMVSFCNS